MIVTEPEGLTAEWLADALGSPVSAVTREEVGTGQMGSCHRLRVTGEGTPASVLVKLPATDPGARAMVAGAYAQELRFYRELAPTVAVRVPAVHFAEMATDGGDFTLVMEDLAPREQGDQIAGCTPARARAAVVNLAGLHGPRWCDPTLADVEGLVIQGPDDAAILAELYGPTTELFIDGRAHLLDDATTATLRDCVDVVGAWVLARGERFGLVHGDYRLDNLMFPLVGAPDEDDVVALDWQTLSLGLPVRDLAYFTGTGLSIDDRRAHEESLVTAYHDALVGHGVTGYDRDLCWDDYRFSMIQGPLVSTFGCAYGARTDRGDRMFAAMVARACAAIRDLGTLELAAAS